MNEVQTKINDAYRILSALSVSGDAVDAMSAVRSILKEAFELAGDKKEGDTSGG